MAKYRVVVQVEYEVWVDAESKEAAERQVVEMPKGLLGQDIDRGAATRTSEPLPVFVEWYKD